jgi:hypothetical protein
MQTKLVAGVCGGVLMGLAGCGGDDKKDAASGKTEPSKAGARAKAPSHTQVLACLEREGLNAKDQSTSTGAKIGLDYPAGRGVITFEDTAEDAEAYASVAKTNGETAIAKGSVAITLPVDPAADAAKPAIEGCVDSP